MLWCADSRRAEAVERKHERVLEQESVYNENVRTVTSEAVGFRGSELYDITSGHICNTYAGYGPSHFFMRKKEMEEIDEVRGPGAHPLSIRAANSRAHEPRGRGADREPR